MTQTKPHHRRMFLSVLVLAGLGSACTTYNPTTGQKEVNYGATAGVAGAAMGAAALGVALSNNDDDRYYGGPGYYGGGGSRHYNRSSKNTVTKVNNVDVDVNKSARSNRINRNTKVKSPGAKHVNRGGRKHR